MKTWLASDIHIGHGKILDYQPERREILGLPSWAKVEDHDAAIIDRWNSVVAPDDFVWFLGDLALGKRHESVPLTGLLNGIKGVIAPGNHDKGLWPGPDTHERRMESRELFRSAGWSIPPYGWLGESWEIAGQTVTYGHLPLAGTPDHDDHEIRYAHMMLPDRGGFHVHGHSHGLNGRIHGQRGRQFDVGLDANELLPTDWTEIVQWVESSL